MIDGSAAEAILPLAESERQMIERDAAIGRVELTANTASILSFCRFLHSIAAGGAVFSVPLPIDHLAFYRNTVERLIEAGELPFFAKERFDEIFCGSLARALGSSADGRPRILHLEDDPFDAELVEREFEASGFPVAITRAASEQAFQIAIKTQPFDLVISDTRLPGFDTLNALAAIRRKSPQIPFIFFTGNADPEFMQETFRRGATDYIGKDDPHRLVDVVRRKCVGSERNLQAASGS